jgi:very-long-chain enoyl-CoA reductase
VQGNLSTRRIGLFLGDLKGRELFDHAKKLKDLNPTSEGLVMSYKDMGFVLPQQVVYNCAYIGPTLLILLFYFCSEQVYGVKQTWRFNQQVGTLVAFLHFFRRVIESNFIHNFTEAPAPIAAVPFIIFYYSGLYGIVVHYFFLQPSYVPWFELSDNTYIALGALFMLFEMLNFRCHCITAALRKPGSNERGIPQGCGFGIVTVANYMWEGFAWFTFIFIAQTYGGIFWSFVSYRAMYNRGSMKHKKYQEQFPDYAKDKKILIPYLL